MHFCNSISSLAIRSHKSDVIVELEIYEITSILQNGEDTQSTPL